MFAEGAALVVDGVMSAVDDAVNVNGGDWAGLLIAECMTIGDTLPDEDDNAFGGVVFSVPRAAPVVAAIAAAAARNGLPVVIAFDCALGAAVNKDRVEDAAAAGAEPKRNGAVTTGAPPRDAVGDSRTKVRFLAQGQQSDRTVIFPSR